MVVVGGRQSGNTRRLADLAAQCGKTTYHIEEASELLPENFSKKNARWPNGRRIYAEKAY